MQIGDENINYCELEKLHLSGASQAWGALLYVDNETQRVTHASQNITDYMDDTLADIVGMSIQDLHSVHAIIGALPSIKGSYLTRFNQSAGFNQLVDIRVIRDTAHVIVEIESAFNDETSLELNVLQRQLLVVPGDKNALFVQHNLLLSFLYTIIGFDRLMIYRFHEDWSGEVIAEHATSEQGSYFNLRFPAADIPAIARNLYLINPCRHIPDSSAAAIPIISDTHTIPDLTFSDLRSVSPVHLQYLANMGVGASFSVPIKVAGKLWGLIACHNKTPKHISLTRREACVALTSTYSLCLSSYFSTKRMEMLDRIDHKIEMILEKIASQQDPLNAVQENGARLLDLIHADGLAMLIDDEAIFLGNTLLLEDFTQFDSWFLASASKMYSSANLSNDFNGELMHAAGICGLVALKVHSPRSGWVRFYWFRKEELYEIAWAGNPNKPLSENAQAAMLSPRRSFEKWIEIRKGYSRVWSTEELTIANKFCNALLRWL